jgi:3-oxoacyl-[acyl-carrier-protein] synthase III
MRLEIIDVAYALPAKVESNDDLSRQYPEWNLKSVESKSGVRARHIAGPRETALDLAKEACDRLLKRRDLATVDAILFCTQTPDYVMPSNAFLLHEYLGLTERVMAFDYNLACSGYVFGLAIAEGLVATGSAHQVLLVNADTYSKLIHPRDRSARVLFGDGAAVTLLGSSNSDLGVLGFEFASAGRESKRFWVQAGGFRMPKSDITKREIVDRSGNVRTSEHIEMDGMGVWAFINSCVPGQITRLLVRLGLEKDDINKYLFHQASLMTLESIRRSLQLPPEKVYINLEMVGNTVSASLPIAFRDAIDSGWLGPGETVVLAGFGVGLSSAACAIKM